jgi:integrase/recombinase XerC
MESNAVGSCVERFLQTKHNAATRAWYAKYLRPMAADLGAERALLTVTRIDAERYWQSVRTRKDCWESHPTRPSQKRALAPASLHNCLRAMRTFWTAMVRLKLVAENPFDHLRAPKDTRPVQMKAIAPDDLRALWAVAKVSGARDYAIVTVIAASGMRAGELVSMGLQRLDLRHGTVWVNGKRGWRKVFLGQASTDAIQVYLRERPANGQDALWLNVNDQPLTADGIRQLVDRLAKRAGIRGRHNLHAFRHRAAQAWLDSGINAEIVSQALGHADVNITLLIYGNQDERRVRSAIRQAEMLPFEDPHGLDDAEMS